VARRGSASKPPVTPLIPLRPAKGGRVLIAPPPPQRRPHPKGATETASVSVPIHRIPRTRAHPSPQPVGLNVNSRGSSESASATPGKSTKQPSTPKVWQNPYRNQPPRSSLGYRTPKPFIAAPATPTGVTSSRAANTNNRVDGKKDATPLPSQATPSTHLQARPDARVWARTAPRGPIPSVRFGRADRCPIEGLDAFIAASSAKPRRR
jgi:hypothetical protein